MQNSDGESNMKNKMPQEYKTKDLGEAAALLCKGAKLLRLEKEANFYWFIFSDKILCEQTANTYWSGDCMVSAKTYQDSMRTLKDRLFANR